MVLETQRTFLVVRSGADINQSEAGARLHSRERRYVCYLRQTDASVRKYDREPICMLQGAVKSFYCD